MQFRSHFDDPGAPPDEDTRLLARAGDVPARFELLQKHLAAMERQAYGMLGNMEDARDAAAEALWRAVKAYPRYNEARSLAAWLSGITHHVCLKIVREREALRPLEDALGLAAPAGEGPEATVLRAETVREVRLAVEGLPDTLRAVAAPHLDEELKHTEIAARLAIPEATARKRWERAQQALQGRLTGAWEEADK